MDDQLFDRVLRAMDEIQDDDEVFCDEMQEVLAGYVERELAGEDVATAQPRVATHLARCIDCREEYESLRELMLALGPEPARVTAPPPDPLATLLAWARTQLGSWRVSLPNMGMALRSAERGLAPLSVPDLEPPTQLQLSLTRRGSAFEVSGVLRPTAAALHGRAVRLYRLAADGSTIDALLASEISSLDRFRLRDVSPGLYVLSIDLPGGETGFTQLTLAEE